MTAIDPDSLAIAARGLSHRFGEADARSQVLFDIDLTVARGEVVVLRGPSGSGKTTLLTLLACLRNLQDGEATVLGESIAGLSDNRQGDLRRRLGFIFQAHNLHDSLTAIQNVRLGLELHGRAAMADRERACAHVLDLVGLADRAHYRPPKLSGGQKQRVAIARALVGNPEIIFADEPTAALDAERGQQIIAILKTLSRRRGAASIIVTHDARVLPWADRIITMENGRIVVETTPEGQRP
jgi:putative ABC transport system ATP-binding protein